MFSEELARLQQLSSIDFVVRLNYTFLSLIIPILKLWGQKNFPLVQAILILHLFQINFTPNFMPPYRHLRIKLGRTFLGRSPTIISVHSGPEDSIISNGALFSS